MLFRKKLGLPLQSTHLRHEHCSVSLPGSAGPWRWQQPPTEYVVLSAVAPARVCNVSVFLFRAPLPVKERFDCFLDHFRLRTNCEVELGGGGNLVDVDAFSSAEERVWWGQYVRLHPEAERLALCRVLCDEVRLAVVYYESYGIEKAAFDVEAAQVARSFELPSAAGSP